MNTQELLNRNSFLEDEVHRCYAEIEDYEVRVTELKTQIKGLEKMLTAKEVKLNEYEEFFDELTKRLGVK